MERDETIREVQLGDNLGFAGIAMGLVGAGLALAYPTKRWIGFVLIGLGLLSGLVWGCFAYKEKLNQPKAESQIAHPPMVNQPLKPSEPIKPKVHSQPERSKYPNPITFKNSPSFDNSTKTFIINAIGKYRGYLNNVGLNVPEDMITVGVATPDGFGGCGGVSSVSPAPAYREGSIYIQETCLFKQRKITDLYSKWVFRKVLNEGAPGSRNDGSNRFQAQDILSDYYVASFEGDPESEGQTDVSWPSVLWVMRNQFGQDFTDRSLANAVTSMNEDFKYRPNIPFDEYFCYNLGVGVSVIDNENRKTAGLVRFLQMRGKCLNFTTKPQ